MSEKVRWAPGCGAPTAGDDPHPRRPARGAQVRQHPGQLGDVGALAKAPVDLHGRAPRVLGQGQDDLLHELGHREPDGEVQVKALLGAQGVQVVQPGFRRAGTGGADQDRLPVTFGIGGIRASAF